MMKLLQLVALCALLCVCACYDSHESSESMEDVFVTPNRANSFIRPRPATPLTPTRGHAFNYYNFVRKIKSPAERRAETCEDFSPCRFYAYRFGYQQAYQRFFAARNPPQRVTLARRY
ncbi:matrix Gla protein [Synchiropus splendidus]|uniref:matrix Gla protein n=1 Tax=Synchiropus splendidus TaxID=270530 RepID=UPI00237ED2D1|nr:matrix Gla protein [Synchiropus splendidus]